MHKYFKNLLIAIAICHSGLLAAESLQITQVSVVPKLVRQRHDTASIQYHLDKPASVCVKIYDARDILVWRECAKDLSAGSHQIQWPGVDQSGRMVEAEAYFYVVEAETSGGEKAVYDLTDVTGGEPLRIDDAVYDSQKHIVKFTAPMTGRYFLRAGIAQSFAVNTLINNEVLTEGASEVRWDGFDASHVFSVADHPKLVVGGFGYRLSDNAIIVQRDKSLDAKDARKSHWSTVAENVERRERIKSVRANVDPNFHRSVELNRDVLLRLTLPAGIPKTKGGLPIIQESTPIRVELSSEDAEIMEAQRGEMVFFWDNQLIYDNEVSYYPYTFNWSPPVLDGGTHLLTAFVAGFGGNIAMATVQVQLGSAPTQKTTMQKASVQKE